MRSTAYRAGLAHRATDEAAAVSDDVWYDSTVACGRDAPWTVAQGGVEAKQCLLDGIGLPCGGRWGGRRLV